MAQRTRAATVLWHCLLFIGLSSMTALGEPEEQPTIPAGAGHLSGNHAERAVPPALIFEALIEHFHQNLAPSRTTHQKGARLGQPVIPSGSTKTSYQRSLRWLVRD